MTTNDASPAFLRMTDRTFTSLLVDEPTCRAVFSALTGDRDSIAGTAAMACEIDRRLRARKVSQ